MTLTQIKPAGLSKPVDLADNEKIRLGTGNDLEIYHSGTQSYIQDTGTGNLNLQGTSKVVIGNAAIDENMAQFFVDGEVALYYNNVKKFETTSAGASVIGSLTVTDDITLQDDLLMGDQDTIKLGDSLDLTIQHDGTDSTIKNLSGETRIQCANIFKVTNYQNTETYIKGSLSGAVELYYDNVKYFETNSTGTKTYGNHIFNGTNNFLQWVKASDLLRSMDSVKVTFGNSDDLQIYHNGSHSFIQDSGTGNLNIQSNNVRINNAAGNENMALFYENGAVELYHNGSKKFETTSSGNKATGKLGLDDGTGSSGSYLSLGTSDDLKIYHDGSNNYIEGNNQKIIIRNTANNIHIQAKSGEGGIDVLPNSYVKLYFDGSEKFETTANGVKVNNRFEMRNGVIFDNTANGNNCGLSFNGDSVRPTNGSGSDIDNARDLGIASVRWNDLWLGGSANIGNYIRTCYNNNGNGGHMYFKNNSQGANYSSHFQTYESSNEGGTTQTHVHYYHGGYCELLHQGNSSVRTRSGGGVLFRNGGTTIGTFDPDGLKFGTDTAEVNALDDYEEGTWTPAFDSFTNVGTSEVRQKIYTKIGNTVHLWLEVFGDNDIGWVDNAYISGTPYSGSSYFPNTLYIPCNVAVMYGGPNYSMDQTAAGRCYYSGYSDKIYLKMGTFANVRHLWLQLTYRTTA